MDLQYNFVSRILIKIFLMITEFDLKVNCLEFRFMESLHNMYSFLKKFEFLRPFKKAAEKTQSCFALDTEQ